MMDCIPYGNISVKIIASRRLGILCPPDMLVDESGWCLQSHVQSTSDRAQFNDLQSHLCATLQVSHMFSRRVIAAHVITFSLIV